MNYNVEITALFEKQLKRLTKKFPSLQKEFAELLSSIKINPNQGTPIGNNCYKIRISIASKGKGKSGGARVISHIAVSETKIYLLSVYDKSEQSDIAPNDLAGLVKMLK